MDTLASGPGHTPWSWHVSVLQITNKNITLYFNPLEAVCMHRGCAAADNASQRRVHSEPHQRVLLQR